MNLTEIVVLIVGGVAIVIVLAILIPYGISSRRNRLKGSHGFVQHSRLTCPKCREVFDYSWIPGSAFPAVRLSWKSRYLACPVCHKWSRFNIWDAALPPTPPNS